MRRRTLLGGMLAGGGMAATSLAGCGDDGSGSGPKTVSLGSNFSDAVPKKALDASITAFEKERGFTVDVNTVEHEAFQEAINNYLQGDPQDVISWFAGFRMQFFAERSLVGDISDVWQSFEDDYSEAFVQASRGLDDKLYFVPFYYYPWAVFYRKSLFDEKGYQIPSTLDEFEDLAKEMQADGLTPIGFADKEGWPAMGTFDAINFRTNGYDFHTSLMRGDEEWTSDEVRETFNTWSRLLPYHQSGSLGRDWLDAADGLLKKQIGMYYLGAFVSQAFTAKADFDDLDFFPFPEINPEHGQDTIEAPIDGWMLAASPDDEESAKELLTWFGGAKAQEAYLAKDPGYVAANSKADTSNYNALQKKATEIVSNTPNITQFLDRDTRPDFASTVMIPSLQTFIEKPKEFRQLTEDIQAQKKSIFGG